MAEPMKTDLRPPRFVGRYTLGLALILVGLLVTASLILPRVDIFWVARFAPLVLVALGIEILISAARNGDRQVKVGLGLSLICLFLIAGAVGAALAGRVLGEELDWRQWQREADKVQLELYSSLDLDRVELVQVSADRLPDSYRVQVELLPDVDTEEEFVQAARAVTQTLAARKGVDYVTILARGDGEEPGFAVDLNGVQGMKDVTPAMLEARLRNI